MALVKTSALSTKLPSRSPHSGEPSGASDRDKVGMVQKRARDRSRAKQEKSPNASVRQRKNWRPASHRPPLLPNNFAARSNRSRPPPRESAGAAQESQAAVNSLGSIFTQGREQAAASRSTAETLQILLTEAGSQIERLVAAVQENSARQLRSVDVVGTLKSQAANIGDITRAVGDVSDQTNLLALNAAIEAARAGDHGRGFSVVADEVRAFAETSEKSAGEVQGLAESVASEVRTVATQIKAAAEQAQRDAQTGREIIGALEGIRKDVLLIADGSREILIATKSAEAGALEAQKGAEIGCKCRRGTVLGNWASSASSPAAEQSAGSKPADGSRFGTTGGRPPK